MELLVPILGKRETYQAIWQTQKQIQRGMSKYKLFPYQEEGVQKILQMKRCLCADDMGTGKEQPLDAIVKTPKGDVCIGNIHIGDYVYSRDGKAHKVTGIFPQGIKPIYKVTFSDGVSTECGLDHLWTVININGKTRQTGWKTHSLRELLHSGLIQKGKDKCCKWFIPMCESVEQAEASHYIHPYLLGVLIGDGCLVEDTRFSNPDIDKDIRIRIEEECLDKDYMLSVHHTTSCPQYNIRKKECNNNPNAYNREIKRLKLNVHSREKFIPDEYLVGSISQRFDLLHGLMDTDGSVTEHSRVRYSTTSRQLAIDMQRLVWSLGGQAIIRNYDRGDKGICYDVNVRMAKNPFYTERKRSQWSIKSKFFPSRGILKAEYVGDKESVCIMVDEPEHTYLTDCFIVTHNTGTSISAIERAGAYPCLVVCPSALKINWQREVENFTNLRPLILSDTNKEAFSYYLKELNLYDVVICNYESLQKFFIKSLGEKPYKLKNFEFTRAKDIIKSVIIDESVRVKEPTTRQTKIVKGICEGKEYIIELSGTPLVNKIDDIACQIAILGRIKEFATTYPQFIEQYGEPQRFAELKQRLHETLYFRREKSEVLKDLPELTRTIVSVDLDKQTKEEYNACLRDLKEYLKEYKEMTDAQAKRRMRMATLIRFMNLRTISGKGKVKAVCEMLRDNPDTQFIVFAEHKDVIESIREAFSEEAVTVTGRDSVMQKQWAIDEFQAKRKRIIICSMRAAGVGLTLTSGWNEIFVELPWTFSDLSQCECRAFRQGQKNAVTSWIMHGNGTIDHVLYNKIMDKRSMLHQVTGAEDSVTFEDERAFEELIDLL